ncbi:flagellar biosynthesis protein FlhF [Allohahella sp. A8]|uniref:flagellar biosynthesis protein FlhF n=1 Tax=Allohahella sp. A8 TaxID=3141461 RepID=UPI000C09702A|nr:flagellar biosynthesis protein FlhF [Hahellaceae bacterium]|tara:strand:- start:50349 stop:51683 length:1335 start_codon:yes stop_codon:yes gene_type:complete
MKQMTFEAATMQLALKRIRDELGEDASILGTSRTANGVQVIVGIDEPESVQTATPMQQPARPRPESRPRFEQQREARDAEPAFAQSQPDYSQHRAEQVRRHQESLQQSRQPAQARWQSAPDSGPNGSVRATRPAGSQTALQSANAQSDVLREMQQQIVRLTEWMQLGSQRPEQRHPLAVKLSDMGFSTDYTDTMLKSALATSQTGASLSLEHLMKHIAGTIPTADFKVDQASGVYVFVGASGTGKTTTIAKLAALLAKAGRAGEVGILSVDRYRVGAAEQLRAYGRLMKITVDVVRPDESLGDALQRFSNKQLVLVDTAGLSSADPNAKAQFNELYQLEQSSAHVHTVLAVSAAQHSKIVKSTYHYYSQLRPKVLMVTKVDEAAELGEVIELAVHNNLPIAYYADGQSIINHLHKATGPSLIKQAYHRSRQLKAGDPMGRQNAI